MASGTTSEVELMLDLDLTGPGRSALRVSNGLPGSLAALLLGSEPIDLPTAFGARLLVVPVVAAAGTFDDRGSFAVPLDIADPALIGLPLLAQGGCFAAGDPEVFLLTRGLVTTFAPGNEQPGLAYGGPPLTAVLVARADPKIDTRHEISCEITAPTTGWSLAVHGTWTDAGVTTLYLVVEGPNPDEVVLPVVTRPRTVVDLGFAAAPRIGVMIERRMRGMATPPAFLLAATIDRDF